MWLKLDFEFSEEQKLIKKSAEEFCRKEVSPYIDKWLKDRIFPRELMKKCASIGWTGMNIREEYGGTPLDNVSQGIITEVIGKYEVPTQIFLSLQLSRLLNYATEECKEKFTGKFLDGDLIICGGFTEPGCGSDAAAITTRAVKDGGEYLINGEKACISGPLYSDIFVISAKTAEIPGKPHKAISLILVEKDREGVEAYELETMAPGFKGDFGGVKFDNVRVPVANLIGEENKGFYLLMNEFNLIRVHVALMALGAAEKSIEEAIEYAKQRRAFGLPISKFQAVSFRLAEHWTKIEAAKLLAYRALWLADKGTPNWAEASAAKWYGCEVAFNAINDALQTYGAYGYTTEYPVERRFRAIRGALIGDGTGDIQKLIISRILFGREYSP